MPYCCCYRFETFQVLSPTRMHVAIVFRITQNDSDWFPTILSAIGEEPVLQGLDLDGVDHWSSLLGVGPDSPRQELVHNLDIWESCTDCKSDDQLQELTHPVGAIRIGDMKLIVNEYDLPWYTVEDVRNDFQEDCELQGESEMQSYLFNITNDPFERSDLYEALPEEAKFLTARLMEVKDSMMTTVWTGRDRGAYQTWDSQGGFITPWKDDTATDLSDCLARRMRRWRRR